MHAALKSVAVGALAALVYLGATQTAAAGSRHHGGSYYGGHHSSGLYYGGRRHGRHHHYHYAVPLAFALGAVVASHRSYYRAPVYYRPPAYRPACHLVVKDAYDTYGRFAKFGGTMCYDRFGRPYIVPGSRHIIHYYR